MKNKKYIATPESIAARSALVQLSEIGHLKVESGEFETVNAFLVSHYAKVKNCKPSDFKTMTQWGEQGIKIKKGAKAVWIWAAPRKGTAKVQAENVGTGETETLEQKYKFWPVCKLFAQSDTEEMSDQFKEFIASRKKQTATA